MYKRKIFYLVLFALLCLFLPKTKSQALTGLVVVNDDNVLTKAQEKTLEEMDLEICNKGLIWTEFSTEFESKEEAKQRAQDMADDDDIVLSIVYDKTSDMLYIFQNESSGLSDEQIQEIMDQLEYTGVYDFTYKFLCTIDEKYFGGGGNKGKVYADQEVQRVVNPNVIVEDDAVILSTDELYEIETMDLLWDDDVMVVVQTTRVNDSESEVARYTHRLAESFDNAVVLVIDMNARYVYMSANGRIKRSIGNEECEAITDNIYKYLTRGQYCEGIKEALTEACNLAKGAHIRKPMKWISSLLTAIITGLFVAMVALWYSIIRRKQMERQDMLGLKVGQKDYSQMQVRFDHSCVLDHTPSSSGSGGSSGGGGGGGGGSSGGGHSF